MRRRKFITLLSGAAVAWPFAMHAQQSAMPVIGFLHSASPSLRPEPVREFRRGLSETGYVVGQNVVIEYGAAEGHYDRLGAMAAEFVRAQVAVIVAAAIPAARAAKAATTTIPIVFGTGVDPVEIGLVTSLTPRSLKLGDHRGGGQAASDIALALPDRAGQKTPGVGAGM